MSNTMPAWLWFEENLRSGILVKLVFAPTPLLWFEENLRSGILIKMAIPSTPRLWFEENLRSGILNPIHCEVD